MSQIGNAIGDTCVEGLLTPTAGCRAAAKERRATVASGALGVRLTELVCRSAIALALIGVVTVRIGDIATDGVRRVSAVGAASARRGDRHAS